MSVQKCVLPNLADFLWNYNIIQGKYFFYMEAMPLVSFENQLSGFYITSTLTLNGIRAGHMKD